MSNVLSIEKLNYSIEGRQIIDNVSLSLSYHKIFAFLGQSGSGKSTLLKLIAGLLEPDSGSLLINKQRIIPPSEKLIAGHEKIKIVRQDNPLFPNITLAENIAYELRFYNEEYREFRVNKLLKLTGLDAVRNQLPRHSSEGEQQRTAIARALADEPSVLLLDEPFSNLDYKNKSRLKSEISSIVHEEEMACIFVTHDISDVLGNADELAILKNGKITQIDSPLTVFKHPRSIYEAALTGDYNLVSASDAMDILEINAELKKIMIRPKDFKINEFGKLIGQVISVLDRGSYFEVLFQIAKLKLVLFTMKEIKVGHNFRFDVNHFSLF